MFAGDRADRRDALGVLYPLRESRHAAEAIPLPGRLRESAGPGTALFPMLPWTFYVCRQRLLVSSYLKSMCTLHGDLSVRT